MSTYFTIQVNVMSLPRSMVERMADKRTMPDFDVVVDLLPSESGSVESPSEKRGSIFQRCVIVGWYGGSLTWHCELGWEVPRKPLSSEVGDRPENDDGTGKARMAERHALVRRELGHGLGPHQVLPMILEN